MQGGPAPGRVCVCVWGEVWVGRHCCFLHMIRGLREGHGPLSGGSALDDPGALALAQDLAELLKTLLHLGDARQLLLKPLLLLSQAEAGG